MRSSQQTSNMRTMAGPTHARGGVSVTAAAAAVVTLLLAATTHARWHDERYHGYELHEAAPYLDYPHHHPPLGKAYQRIQYHLTDSSSRRGFDEQFPPLYHGAVSLPPDYPRSVRQKRRALSQQSYAKVTTNMDGELNTPKTTVGLHGGRIDHTQKMSHETDRDNLRNKSKILEVQYRQKIDHSRDGQAKNNRTEDKANVFTSSQEEYEENSIGDNKSLGQRKTTNKGANEMDIDATDIRGQRLKQEKVSGTTRRDARDVEGHEGSKQNRTKKMGEGNGNAAKQIADVTLRQVVDRKTAEAAAPRKRTQSGKVEFERYTRAWAGSYDATSQSDVSDQERQSNLQQGVHDTTSRTHDKTSTKRYQRKTHLSGDNGSDLFLITGGKEDSSDNQSSRRVGIAETNAHTEYHTRHGYGKISDILGDFFRQPRGQTSTGDTELGGRNNFKNESDDRIMMKLNNSTLILRQKNLSGQYPTDYETAGDDGDFDTEKGRPVVPEINFWSEKTEPPHLQQEGKRSHHGDHDTVEKGGSARPGNRWSSYLSPPESYSHEPRNRDTAYEPINYKEPNKEEEHGPQNYGGSTGDIIYGSPTFDALNFGNFDISRPRHDLGSGPGGVTANTLFMRAVPRSLHGDASLSGAHPAQSLVAVSGHSSYEAAFDTPNSYDVYGDNKVATDGILEKTSKVFGKNFALPSNKFPPKIETSHKLPTSKFDHSTQHKQISAADANDSEKNAQKFRKPILTNENYTRPAEPAPVLKLDAQYHPKLARELNYANSGVSEQAQVRETPAGRAYDGVQDFATHPEFGIPSVTTTDFDGTASSHSNQYAALIGLLPSLYGRENLPFKQERRKGGGGGGGGEGGKIHLLLVPEGDYKIYMPTQTSGGVTSGGRQHGSTIINLAAASGSRGHGSSSAGQLNKLQLINKLLHW